MNPATYHLFIPAGKVGLINEKMIFMFDKPVCNFFKTENIIPYYIVGTTASNGLETKKVYYREPTPDCFLKPYYFRFQCNDKQIVKLKLCL